MSAKKSTSLAKRHSAVPAPRRGSLLGDVRHLILAAKESVARAVDAGQLFSNWHIGTRTRTDILKLKRAEYGARIVSTLSRQLEPEFGRGYSEKSLRHMVRFAESFPDLAIVSTLSRQLGWSHFLEIFYMKDDLQRDFYAEMCRINGWPVRLLRERIDSLLYGGADGPRSCTSPHLSSHSHRGAKCNFAFHY